MLITGVSGLLGNNLAYYFNNKYKILGLYCSHPVSIVGIQTKKCDLSCYGRTKNIIEKFDPAIIIHCASLTNIDQCESNPEIASKVNVRSTKNIVDIIFEKDVKLVYISTDSVYDGVKGNFSEKDPVNPKNYYGESKYKGELEVLRKREIMILRTNIFGWNVQKKYSIAEWILHELSNKRPIKGFNDVSFSSIYNFELAKILDIAIDHDLTGLFNCASSTSLSKYEFVLHVADCFNLDKDLIQPISIDDFNLGAERGKNLTLNVNKLKNALNCNLPTISESIVAFYKDFNNGLPKIIGKEISVNPIA